MSSIKDQTAILAKLGIKELNPMQEEALSVIGFVGLPLRVDFNQESYFNDKSFKQLYDAC